MTLRHITLGALAAAWALGFAEPGAAIEPAPSEAASGEVLRMVEYTVVPGDTVFVIAMRFGSTVERVVRENEIADVLKLYVGTRLRIPVVGPPRPVPAMGQPRTARPRIDELLERAETQLRQARFESALQTSELALERLRATGPRGTDTRIARLEVVAATAHVALGHSDAALDSLDRALRADPQLQLDELETSPKVMEIFLIARRRAGDDR